jgi:hypothetical protein
MNPGNWSSGEVFRPQHVMMLCYGGASRASDADRFRADRNPHPLFRLFTPHSWVVS